MFKINKLWLKIALSSVLAIIVMMSFIMALQFQTKRANVASDIQSELQGLGAIAAHALSDPLWNYNLEGVDTVAKALFNHVYLQAVIVIDDYKGVVYQDVVKQKGDSYELAVPILKDQKQIGTLRLAMNDQVPLNDLWVETSRYLVDNLVITLVMTLIVALIAYVSTQPLSDLTEAISKMGKGSFEIQISSKARDEVGILAKEFNVMSQEIKRQKEEWTHLNKVLDSEVKVRTSQLYESNEQLVRALGESKQMEAQLLNKNEVLRQTIDQLKETREELVQATKKNITSQVIAGIAHEINTPVGVALTTCSYLNQEIQSMQVNLSQGKGATNLDEDLEGIIEATQLIQRNLEHSATLIANFKEVVVDQAGLRRRKFNLNHYIHEVFANLKSAYKHTKHTIDISCPEDIVLDSYPGAFSQVFTNLLMNSLEHGFEFVEEGTITLKVDTQGDHLHMVFTDNGQGIPQENLDRIFDPFYSTHHGQGGSGLGLSVISNLVTSVLKGEIKCQSQAGQGVTFNIQVPRNPHDEPHEQIVQKIL